MSRITQRGATAPFGLFINDTEAQDVTYTGQKFDLADGREVTLVSAGVSNIVSGVLVQGSAIVANHQNLAVVSAVTAGPTANSITVTLAGTAATANEYAGGYAVINAGPGIGQTLQIASHPAQTNTTGNLVLTLADAVQVSLTTSSKVCLIPNIYAGVIINPTSPTNTPVGVTLYPLTAGSYGYVVSKGVTSLLADGSISVGSAVSPSNGTAGAVEAGVIGQGFVGRALQAGVTTESRAIYVDL